MVTILQKKKKCTIAVTFLGRARARLPFCEFEQRPSWSCKKEEKNGIASFALGSFGHNMLLCAI